MQRHAPYSQTFRLPFTDRNNVFFAHFYEVTLTDGDFDPTQKTEVLIFEDGVQVIRGLCSSGPCASWLRSTR